MVARFWKATMRNHPLRISLCVKHYWICSWLKKKRNCCMGLLVCFFFFFSRCHFYHFCRISSVLCLQLALLQNINRRKLTSTFSVIHLVNLSKVESWEFAAVFAKQVPLLLIGIRAAGKMFSYLSKWVALAKSRAVITLGPSSTSNAPTTFRVEKEIQLSLSVLSNLILSKCNA